MWCLRFAWKHTTSGSLWTGRRRISSSVSYPDGDAVRVKAPIKWLQRSSLSYKTVVLQRAYLEPEGKRSDYPAPLNKEWVGLGEQNDQDQQHKDPLVVGIMLDSIDEENAISTREIHPIQPRRTVITLYPPDSDPDSHLDGIYSPGRPQLDEVSMKFPYDY